MEPIKFGWDIETNGFLEDHIDYTEVPYKLKDSFKIHCIVVIYENKIIAFHDGPKFIFDGSPFHINLDEYSEKYSYTFEGYEPLNYIHRPLSHFVKFIQWLPKRSIGIAHNQINFDLLAIKLYYGIDYKVEINMDTPLGDDTWDGKEIIFDDTLVRSKTLNPDRYGGHSLMNLSSKGETQKMEFRYHVPESVRFLKFDADMVYYNIVDVQTNIQVAEMLDREQALEWPEAKDWNPSMWAAPIKLEKQVMELVTRQQHRGFFFNKELAEQCIAELDEMMAVRKEKIEAILPDRPATKGFMNDYSPPAKQFKKNGDPTNHMINFVTKIEGELIDTEEGWTLKFRDNTYKLPLANEPLITTMKATINDTTHIKEWLVSLGWKPLEYKEKDLTVDQKKNKLSDEKLDAAIERYIQQTINSNFLRDRMEFLELNVGPRITPESARMRLQAYFNKRRERSGGIKVITNPSFTVGQDKEVCRNLKALAESSEELNCITDITEYLTYRHRRNSILGGGVSYEDFEDDTDAQTAKGYLPNLREDGRIPTPAGTCDAATSRMRHRIVVNVPRESSLYGGKMRALFMADSNVAWQLGYDFASLEARIEGHYCWKFEDGTEKEYCISLIQEKPHDVHTMMAQRISEIIGREFPRSTAKNVKYGATYGAQAAKIAKTIGSALEVGQQVFEAFWMAAEPLAKLKNWLKKQWEKEFAKKKIIGIDGRLVPTRSAHAILNSLFQGGGVICAKKVMVYHDRLAAAEGMIVDFFTQSLDDVDAYWQQMIAMHDEAQGEVDKASVKFKMFTKEALGWQKLDDKEAQKKEDARCEAIVAAFKAEQSEVWSDVQHSERGWFVAYCRQGELIAKAVELVNRDFKLNVPLEAGYVLGRDWKDCH